MSNGAKVLIAYYSRRGKNYARGGIVDLAVGNTEVVARKIEALTGGTLFEIKTVKSYPEDYRETTRVAKAELNNNSRPELTGRVDDMSSYQIVYLGYPNWWSTMPMAVFTFLESYEFSGKTIMPFCTHEGSGMGHSVNDIKTVCSHANIGSGLAVQGSSVAGADRLIENWIENVTILNK